MAAPPLRNDYDCAVIGSGWAAALFANAFARAGLPTVLVADESPRAVDAWLHPRLEQNGLHELPQLRSVRGVVVHDIAGEVIQVLRTDLLEPARSDVTYRNENTSGVFSGQTLLQHQGGSARKFSRCIFEFAPRQSNRSAVGGIYRQVAMGAGDEHSAHLFPTRLPGVVAWLAAFGNGLFSLGVIRTGRGNPIWSTASAAELFEEALVACPALTRRLAQAQLVGDLHWRGAQSPVAELSRKKDAIVLSAYDAEIDPLFASGFELATRGAQKLTDLLVACRYVPGKVRQRIAEWREGWLETEQGVRNLVHYYYSCPQQRDRCPADSVQVQPESSPDFA